MIAYLVALLLVIAAAAVGCCVFWLAELVGGAPRCAAGCQACARRGRRVHGKA